MPFGMPATMLVMSRLRCLLGDTIMDSVIPVTQQLIDTYEQFGGSVIAVEEVPHDKVNRYGIVGGKSLSDRILELDTLVEKPVDQRSPVEPGHCRSLYSDARNFCHAGANARW